MTRIGFDFLSFAASALAHMYSKCVNIQNAEKAFKRNASTRFSFMDFPCLINLIEYFDKGKGWINT